MFSSSRRLETKTFLVDYITGFCGPSPTELNQQVFTVKCIQCTVKSVFPRAAIRCCWREKFALGTENVVDKNDLAGRLLQPPIPVLRKSRRRSDATHACQFWTLFSKLAGLLILQYCICIGIGRYCQYCFQYCQSIAILFKSKYWYWYWQYYYEYW